MNKRLLLAMILLVPFVVHSIELPAQEEQSEGEGKLYKYQNKEGITEFTDVKPNANSKDEGIKIETIEAQPENLNVLEPKTSAQKKYEEEILSSAEKERKEKAVRKEKINAAEKALSDALAAQEKGKETTDEDWQRTVKGKRFLKQSYYDRQEKLEQSVERARARLKAIKAR